MAPNGLGIVAFVGLLATPALAECTVKNLATAPLEFSAAPPPELDLSLRPVLPDCLRGLSGPEQENCPQGVIAAYGSAVEAWVAALNGFVSDTNRFANEVVVFANSAIARNYADAALDFAYCEAAAISAASER